MSEKRIALRLPEVIWNKLNQKAAKSGSIRVNGKPNVSAYLREIIDHHLSIK